MPGITTSAAIYGIEARPVTVEVDVHGGLPKVMVVGLPDAAIQEARERIRSAVKNSGAVFPLAHVTMSLSPADWRKEGSGFDLPVAIALLLTTQQISDRFNDLIIVGELNLSGLVQPTNGVLAIAELARKMRRGLMVPRLNAAEASMISGVKVIAVDSLAEIMTMAASNQKWNYFTHPKKTRPSKAAWSVWPMIQGQAAAKRAMTIAAAGGHNILMVGPPGAGKTMLARGLRELLPPISEIEALTVTKIHSISGQLPPGQALITARPFRQPHHTASVAALVGGGRVPKPGELSLAHHGVLFLDEFAEFTRDHIEALRQPLEDGVVTVSRVAGSAQFPAAGMLVAAMNPCPCGYLNDQSHPCRCTPSQVQKYLRRISGPVLDRFDIFINVPRIRAQEIIKTSIIDDPRPVILNARQQQKNRTHDERLVNSQLRGARLTIDCQLEPAEHEFLKQAMERLRFSMRAYHRILRVSRTIADMNQQSKITIQNLAEALQYRPPAGLV